MRWVAGHSSTPGTRGRAAADLPNQEGGTYVEESPRPNPDMVLVTHQQRHVRRIQQPHSGNQVRGARLSDL